MLVYPGVVCYPRDTTPPLQRGSLSTLFSAEDVPGAYWYVRRRLLAAAVPRLFWIDVVINTNTSRVRAYITAMHDGDMHIFFHDDSVHINVHADYYFCMARQRGCDRSTAVKYTAPSH